MTRIFHWLFMRKMDPMSGFDIRLVLLPPSDSTLQYKKCIHLWNNFPCIKSLVEMIKCFVMRNDQFCQFVHTFSFSFVKLYIQNILRNLNYTINMCIYICVWEYIFIINNNYAFEDTGAQEKWLCINNWSLL